MYLNKLGYFQIEYIHKVHIKWTTIWSKITKFLWLFMMIMIVQLLYVLFQFLIKWQNLFWTYLWKALGWADQGWLTSESWPSSERCCQPLWCTITSGLDYVLARLTSFYLESRVTCYCQYQTWNFIILWLRPDGLWCCQLFKDTKVKCQDSQAIK